MSELEEKIQKALSITALISHPTPLTNRERIETVSLDWHHRQKTRQRLLTNKGTELLLMLPRGTVLQEGDLLYQDPECLIRVQASPERVVVVVPHTLQQHCRIAHHLGNWHRPLQLLEDGTLIAQADQPLEDWLMQMGIPFQVQEHPFTPTLSTGHHHS
jgi:urease accessory protein